MIRSLLLLSLLSPTLGQGRADIDPELKDIKMCNQEVDTLNSEIQTLISTNIQNRDEIDVLTEEKSKLEESRLKIKRRKNKLKEKCKSVDTNHFFLHMFVPIINIVCIVLGIVLFTIVKIIEKFEKKNSIKTSQTEMIECTCDPEGAQDLSCQRCSEITIEIV